jgi:hypothetical protein
MRKDNTYECFLAGVLMIYVLVSAFQYRIFDFDYFFSLIFWKTMEKQALRLLICLTFLLAASLLVVSYVGAFVPGTYRSDAPSIAYQGMGQDMVDLFIAVPMLILSLILMLGNKVIAYFFFGGTVFYILYSFVIYCFGVHFNRLFLLYCMTLGLTIYIFILLVSGLSKLDVKGWFRGNIPCRLTGVYFIIVAAIFCFLWLKEIIPALVTNAVPKSVADYGLLVNPVHVADLSFALPGLIIVSVLLFKKYNLGYILAPMGMVFIILLAFALAGMVLMLKYKGLSEDISVAAVFIVLAAVNMALLYLFMRGLNIKAQ